MKIKKEGNTTRLWISSRETWSWANKPNSRWSCSSLADRRVYIELNGANDIVYVKINGRDAKDLDFHELRCCLNDLTKGK